MTPEQAFDHRPNAPAAIAIGSILSAGGVIVGGYSLVRDVIDNGIVDAYRYEGTNGDILKLGLTEWISGPIAIPTGISILLYGLWARQQKSGPTETHNHA